MQDAYVNLLLLCDVADQFIEVAKSDQEEQHSQKRILLSLIEIEDILDKNREYASSETRSSINIRMNQIRAEISELIEKNDGAELSDHIDHLALSMKQWVRNANSHV